MWPILAEPKTERRTKGEHLRYDFPVGMAPGPDFFAKVARGQDDEQVRLKHYWRLQKAFDAIREWGRSIQRRVRHIEARADRFEKRLGDLERKKNGQS